VINFVKSLADKHVQMISPASQTALFQAAYNSAAQKAQAAIGANWTSLPTPVQVAMIDLAYNVGSVFPGVAAALGASTGPDYLQAAFQLVNAKRTFQVQNRTEADFENLLLQFQSQLGNLVGG
jgi:hypothetical protein